MAISGQPVDGRIWYCLTLAPSRRCQPGSVPSEAPIRLPRLLLLLLLRGCGLLILLLLLLLLLLSGRGLLMLLLLSGAVLLSAEQERGRLSRIDPCRRHPAGTVANPPSDRRGEAF